MRRVEGRWSADGNYFALSCSGKDGEELVVFDHNGAMLFRDNVRNSLIVDIIFSEKSGMLALRTANLETADYAILLYKIQKRSRVAEFKQQSYKQVRFINSDKYLLTRCA